MIGSILLDAGNWDSIDSAPLWVGAGATAGLQLGLLGVALWAAATKGFGPVRDFGLAMRWSDLPVGVFFGVLGQLVLVPIVMYPILWLTDKDAEDVGRVAQELADRAVTPFAVVSLLIAAVVLAPIAEEVAFRGLLFGAFKKRKNVFWRQAGARSGTEATDDTDGDDRDSRANVVIAGFASALLFALTHFQPLLIPALTAVGGLFAWLYHRSGRLAPAIWAHAAFNGTTLYHLLA